MMEASLQGKLVRLAAPNAEIDAEQFAGFWRDSEFTRLSDVHPARFADITGIKEDWAASPDPNGFFYLIHSLAHDKLVGFVRLWLSNSTWLNRDGWLGIGIGDREYWGNGFGTDALHVMLQYGFAELNLHRVSLGVFSYNARAIRAYEKAGFRVEGRSRDTVQRNGQRFDVVWMGLLRDEWERQQ